MGFGPKLVGRSDILIFGDEVKNRRNILLVIRCNPGIAQSVKHGQTIEELLQNQSFRYKRSDDIADWRLVDRDPIGKSRDPRSAPHSSRLRSVSLDLGSQLAGADHHRTRPQESSQMKR